MNLEYNIYYELTAAMFMFVLCFYTKMQYNNKSEQNKAFMMLMIEVLVCDVFDVITAITISYAEFIPVYLNQVLNAMYFICNTTLGYGFLKYALNYNKMCGKRTKVNFFEKSLFLSYHFIALVGIFTGWLVYFEDNKYQHGILYPIVYIIPYIYFFETSYIMTKALKYLNWKKRISIILYILIIFTGAILQIFFYPQVLLTSFSICLSVVVILVSLETPEYQKLMDTMKALEIANEDAKFANEAKSTFLANMSHEIRTPINAVLGMDEMILRESDNDDIISYANSIQNAGNTLLSLINDILDFSKIESGKMQIIDNEYELKDIIKQCYEMILPRAEAKNLKYNIEVDTSTPNFLIGDEVRIKQVITNLLTNAVKYTSEGSVTLRVKYSYEEDDIIKLLVSVEDTGMGITMENQEKLFNSFQRVDENRNRGIEGTGLGLAITKQLVTQMRGQIGLYSKPNEGSLFYIEVPQVISKNVPIGELELGKTKVEKKKYVAKFTAPEARILVVDDVAMNLSVFKNLLKKTLIQIDTATSGMEALDLTMDNHYDIIFMDDMMPHMDGSQTLKTMKERNAGPNIGTPVIVLTANAVAGMKDEYIKKGFDDYISKPVTGDILESVVRDYLPKSLLTE